MTVDILGLGTAAMDIVLQCEELPKEDGFSFIHNENIMPGGSCANVLVALNNLNIKTSLVAQLGDDYYGKLFLQDIVQSGIATEHIYVKEQGVSLHTFVTVAQKGSRAIYCNLGNSLLDLSEEMVNIEMLQGVKVFYTDMFPVKPALKLAELCKKIGIPVAVNLQCAPSFMELCQAPKAELEKMLTMADIIFACREGLLELAACTDFYQAGKMIYTKFQPQHGLVFTLGERGALAFSKTGILEVPAFRVDAIDTTGAGDAFIGGFLYGFFIRKMPKEEAIRFANACAAIKCTQLGPRLKATELDILNLLNK